MKVVGRMTEDLIKEKNFEEAIEEYLITSGGYIKGNPNDFDRVSALDKGTLLSFIKETQPKKWERYCTVYGASAEDSFIKRFSKIKIDSSYIEWIMSNKLYKYNKALLNFKFII